MFKRANITTAKQLLVCIFACLVSAYSFQAHALQSIDTSTLDGRLALGSHVVFYEDTTAGLSASDTLALLNNNEFNTPKSPSLQFSYKRSAIWLAVNFENKSLNDIHRIIEIRYAPLDLIEIYTQDHSSNTLQLLTTQGDKQPYHAREIQSRHYFTPLTVQANQNITLLIKVMSSSSITIPVYISDQQSLYEADHDSLVIIGIFYGISIGLLLYNLFLFFTTKTRMYLLYVLYITGYTLFMASLEGFLYKLWPNSPDWESRSIYFFVWSAFVFLTQFCRDLLKTKEESPKSDLALKLLMYFFLIGSIAILIIDDVYILGKLNSPAILFTVMSLLVIMIIRYKQGSKEAAFTMIGMGSFCVGMLAVAGGTLNLHDHYEIAPTIMKLGSAIEMILFSIALAHKINTLEINNKLSKQEALTYLKNYDDLYQNSIEGQFQINDKGLFLKSNPAWRDIIGSISEVELKSNRSNFKSIFVDHHEYFKMWEVLNEKNTISGHIVKIKPFDSDVYKIISLSIRKEKIEGEDSWVGTASDITEKHTQEERLKAFQLEKTKSLKQLVMGVSHEMNTPLGNIKMAHSFLHETVAPLKINNTFKIQINDGIDIIQSSVDKLNDLGRLMKQSVVSKNTLHEDNIHILEWLTGWKANFCKHNDKITFDIKVDDHKAHWKTYPEALTIILEHLSENSVTHNQELYNSDNLVIEIHLSIIEKENNTLLELHYKDNGAGIEDELKHDIFQPFYTTRRQHAKGLGLYQTQNLITEVLDGSLEWPPHNSGFELVIRFPFTQES